MAGGDGWLLVVMAGWLMALADFGLHPLPEVAAEATQRTKAKRRSPKILNITKLMETMKHEKT